MGSLRIVPILLLLASPALAQTYGVGQRSDRSRTRPGYHDQSNGSGTSSGPRHRRGRRKCSLSQKSCVACHGPAGAGGVTSAPNLLGE